MYMLNGWWFFSSGGSYPPEVTVGMLALWGASPRQDHAPRSTPSYYQRCMHVCQLSFYHLKMVVTCFYQKIYYVLVVLNLSVPEIISICNSMMMSA